MQLVIAPNGTIRCLYDELIDLHRFGRPEIKRASTVEPNFHGEWFANLAPCGGPVLGPFRWRSAALAAERDWLEQNLLIPPGAVHDDPVPEPESEPEAG